MEHISDRCFVSPEQETISGFTVSEKRKKIWNTELDLLFVFTELCRKHGLKYYAANGTLLGAVRHHGFIPWDDDVDVMMPRPDYEKFLKAAADELSFPYLLHLTDTEGIYRKNYARLRNCNTTALTEADWGRSSCQGIFIDIFPMDLRPVSDTAWFLQKCSLRLQDILIWIYVYHFSPNRLFDLIENIIWRIMKVTVKASGYLRMLKRYERTRTRYNNSGSDTYYVEVHGLNFYLYPAEYFRDSLNMDFNGISLCVPSGYKEILTGLYGDYSTLPPVSKRGQHHHIFFDPDVPYTEYAGRLTKEEARANQNNY